jgi:hypothetical protein
MNIDLAHNAVVSAVTSGLPSRLRDDHGASYGACDRERPALSDSDEKIKHL